MECGIKDFNYCEALTKESDDLLEYVNKLLMDRPLEEKERYCHLIGELFDQYGNLYDCGFN